MIKRAFTYMFEDDYWIIKHFSLLIFAGVYSTLLDLHQHPNYIFSDLSVFFNNYHIDFTHIKILFVILFILPFYGYLVGTLHNEINNLKPVLPVWKGNYIRFCIVGFLAASIFFFYQFIMVKLPCKIFPNDATIEFLATVFSYVITIPALAIFSDKFNIIDSFNIKKVISKLLNSIEGFLPVSLYIATLSVLTGNLVRNIRIEPPYKVTTEICIDSFMRKWDWFSFMPWWGKIFLFIGKIFFFVVDTIFSIYHLLSPNNETPAIIPYPDRIDTKSYIVFILLITLIKYIYLLCILIGIGIIAQIYKKAK